MAICPICGGPIPEQVEIQELDRDDPALAGAIERFIRCMGLKGKRQDEFLRNLEPFSTWTLKETFRIWESKKLYGKKQENYFLGICRRVEEERQRDLAVNESLPPAFGD